MTSWILKFCYLYCRLHLLNKLVTNLGVKGTIVMKPKSKGSRMSYLTSSIEKMCISVQLRKNKWELNKMIHQYRWKPGPNYFFECWEARRDTQNVYWSSLAWKVLSSWKKITVLCNNFGYCRSAGRLCLSASNVGALLSFRNPKAAIFLRNLFLSSTTSACSSPSTEQPFSSLNFNSLFMKPMPSSFYRNI